MLCSASEVRSAGTYERERLGPVAGPLLDYDPALDVGKLRALENYEAPFLQERLGLEEDEYRVLFDEFKKYAGLTQVADGKLGMPSKDVDEIWHQFILFTREYAQFCDDTLGYFLHHSPSVSTDKTMPGDTNRFINLYQAVYGALPSIWGVDAAEWCSSGGCGSGCGDGCGNDCASCGSDGSCGD